MAHVHRQLIKLHENHPNFDQLQSVSPAQDGIASYVEPIARIKAQAYQGHLQARLEGAALADILREQAEQGSRFWLITDAQDSQSPLAFARTTEHSSTFACIDEVLVHPDHIRKGLGSLVVHTALTSNFNLISTTINALHNQAADGGGAFYASLGFSEHSNPSRHPERFGDSTASGRTTLYGGDSSTIRQTIETKYPWISVL